MKRKLVIRKLEVKNCRAWAKIHKDKNINKTLTQLAKEFKISLNSILKITKEFKIKSRGSTDRFCKNGHDTKITGRYSGGQCIPCTKVRNKKRREDVKSGKLILVNKKQFCVYGHDTFICGRNNGGACRECLRIRGRKHFAKNKKKMLSKMKEYYKNHKEEYRLWGIKYRAEKGEELLEQRRQYNYAHRKERNTRLKEKRMTNMNHKLQVHLRSRIRLAIRNNQKTGSAVKDLGCTIEFLKQYITKKFYGKMTWKNWGTVWELDHVKPLKDFNLTDRQQFLKAVHYTNLQPLTIEDHRKKTNKEISKSPLTKLNKNGKLQKRIK